MISGTRSLFVWSLRSDSRALSAHIVRAAFAGFLLLTVMLAWTTSVSGIAPGLTFFRTICFLNVLTITVAGVSYFVSAVTEEKEAGTLPLLRLAGVSGLAIVVSKSVSRLISSLMLLMVQLPFTFLAVTLGGVTWQQVVAAWLALAAWMCLVANIALFCSVRCATAGRAAGMATCVLLLLFAAGPLLLHLSTLNQVPWISPALRNTCADLHHHLQLVSVLVRLDDILQAIRTTQLFAEQFWRSLIVGSLLFVISVLLFGRSAGPETENPHGRSAAIRRWTVGRCWHWPVVWKDFLFFFGGRQIWTLKFAAYLALLIGFGWFHQLEFPRSSRWQSPELVRFAFLVIAILLTVEILLHAASTLSLEAHGATIASLKMLPLSVSVILLQKTVAVLLSVLPAIVMLLVLLLYDHTSVLDLQNSPRDNTLIGPVDAIFRDLPGTIVGWVIAISVAIHLALLLSLYARWAALPLAVLITTVSFPCIGAAALGLMKVTETATSVSGITWGMAIGVSVNLVWLWLFVLLPIEIEIVNRWNRLSSQ